MSVPVIVEVDSLACKFIGLEISSRPIFCELLALLEGKDGSSQKLLARLIEAFPTLTGEELLVLIVSLVAIDYRKLPVENMQNLMQILFVICPLFFSDKLNPKAFECLASETDWWQKAVSLMHHANNKEEIVSYCIHLIRDVLPNTQVKAKKHKSLPDTPLHPTYFINGCPLSDIGAAYFFCYRFVELLDPDEDTDQVVKTIFYKQASFQDVEPERVLAGACLYTLIWGLLLNRTQSELGFIKDANKKFPPERFIGEVRPFIVDLLKGARLHDLTQLATTRAIFSEVFQEHNGSHDCLKPLQLMTTGKATCEEAHWMRRLDLLGLDLLDHFISNHKLDSRSALQLIPDLLRAVKLTPDARVNLVQKIVDSSRAESPSMQLLAELLVALCRFIGSLSESDKTFPECLLKCSSIVRGLHAHEWEYDLATLAVHTEIMFRLQMFEKLFRSEKGYWIDKIATNVILKLAKDAKELIGKTRGPNTNQRCIEEAVLKKNEILQIVKACHLYQGPTSKVTNHGTVLLLSKVHLSALAHELHLVEIDDELFVETNEVLITKKPLLKKSVKRAVPFH